MTPQKVLITVIRELVQTGAYKDEQSALRAMAIEQAIKKVKEYRRTIAKFQRKYKLKDLQEFTLEIEGQASIQQEDDWLEWKGASVMLEGWEKTFRKLTSSDV